MILKPERMAGVHPHLVNVAEEAAKNCPFDIMVLEGVRSKERQAQLVAAGASKTLDGRHLKGSDGLGHAIDLAPVLDTDGDGTKEISWHWPHYYQLAPIVKAAAEKLKVPVVWGGDWPNFKDGPHWELPRALYP